MLLGTITSVSIHDANIPNTKFFTSFLQRKKKSVVSKRPTKVA